MLVSLHRVFGGFSVGASHGWHLIQPHEGSLAAHYLLLINLFSLIASGVSPSDCRFPSDDFLVFALGNMGRSHPGICNRCSELKPNIDWRLLYRRAEDKRRCMFYRLALCQGFANNGNLYYTSLSLGFRLFTSKYHNVISRAQNVLWERYWRNGQTGANDLMKGL